MTAKRERQHRKRATMCMQLQTAEDKAEQLERIRQTNLWKSDVLTDLAQLVFAGVIIGGVFQPVERPLILYSVGVLTFVTCIAFGYAYYKRGL